MGTNYYLRGSVCHCCGRGDEMLHIGKSSAGWCFMVRIHPDLGIASLDDWKRMFQAREIQDEYGQKITEAEMLRLITERNSGRTWEKFVDSITKAGGPLKPYSSESAFHAANHSERGPNGLLRHRLGTFCTGHGEGPWDYTSREFS